MSDANAQGDGAPDARQAVTRPVPLRKLMWTILTLTVPLAVYFLLPLDGEFGAILAGVLVLAAAGSLVPLSFQQARLVLRSEHPLFDAGRCLVTGFVLLVVVFSSAYYIFGTSDDPQIQNLSTKLDAVYFAVTILATVGFGDIVATGQGARATVTLQMVINFALLGVALRVLSWALKERQREHTSLQRRIEQGGRVRTRPPR
jgi:hypothetical protein